MRIPSYKTSSAILIEEYYVFSKMKYQASCTLTSIKSSASMNKCISHVEHHTLLTGVLTPAAKDAKPIQCPGYISEPNLSNVLVTFQRLYADSKFYHFIPRWVLNGLLTEVIECVINHCFKAKFFCSRDNVFAQ